MDGTRHGGRARPPFAPVAALVAAATLAGAALAGAARASAEGGAPHWGYAGKNGPKAWGKLAPAFRTCDVGADQSPIDLRGAAPGEGDRLRFDYAPSPVSLVNDGHTLRMDYAAGSAFENGRGRYELAQFHFHSPSEHTVAGKAFPMELHLVHKGEGGALAVVGVLLELGARNPTLAAVFDNAPKRAGESTRVPGLLLDATALLPRAGGYWTYPGSLTTPPCSEGVSWQVLKTPLAISKEQLAAFRKAFGSNARPTQPLRDRVLREM